MDDFTGQIIAVGFSYAPQNYAFCAGQLMPISNNPALYSLIGISFGGDGRATFGLPDLRGRTPIGAGSGPGLTPHTLGDRAGHEYVQLTTLQLPPHTHTGDTLTVSLAGLSVDLTGVTGTQQISDLPGDTDSASDAYVAASSSGNDVYTEDASTLGSMKPGTIQLAGNATITGSGSVSGDVSFTGGGSPISVMQPYLAINYCMCLQGIYPPRS